MQDVTQVQERVNALMEGVTRKVEELVMKGYQSGAIDPEKFSNEMGEGWYELPNILLRAALEEITETMGPIGRRKEFFDQVKNVRYFL